MKKMLSVLSLTIGVVLIVACSVDNAKPTKTSEPVTDTILSTPETQRSIIKNTDTPRSQIPKTTPTASPAQISQYRNLSPGQYLVYTAADGLSVMNMDNSLSMLLTPDETAYLVSQGGRKAVIYGKGDKLYLVDLASNSSKELDNFDCSTRSSSPDGDYLLQECKNGSIKLYSVKDGFVSLLRAPKNSKEYFRSPLWSPDGRWISYLNQSIDSMKTGLYIIDTNCLSLPDSCQQKTKGPYFANFFLNDAPYGWSPDSRYIVIPAIDGNIVIFDTQTESSRNLDLPENRYALSTAWSPDGEAIAFTDESTPSICLMFVNQDKLSCFTKPDTFVENWLLVPTLFLKGKAYEITEAGDNLNLRQNPSRSAASLAKVRKGDIVTIIDGPTNSDGYTWWNVQTVNGVTGWVVDIPEYFSPK